MSSMPNFSWPQRANMKRYERSEPVPAPGHRPLMIGVGIAATATGIIVIYTVFFFALKYRKARAAKKQSQDTEAEVKTIELIDNEHPRGGPSPYVGDGHQGGGIGNSRSARTSSELPVHYARVVKDDGKLGFVEVDISSEKVKD